MAIRQAVAAGANITYKILYNDAVAMTGGQPVDGPISVEAIATTVRRRGRARASRWSPTSRRSSTAPLPARHDASTTAASSTPCSASCARSPASPCSSTSRPAPPRSAAAASAARSRTRRVFAVINELVCEGCGDCSVESNCLSVEPLETEFGRKRRINLSTCNKDFSCLNGFCPSFVTVEGATRRKRSGAGLDVAALAADIPAPEIPALGEPYDLLVTGVGGTGVVTVGALITMAAHLEGKGASVLDFTGFAQKFGPVLSFIRLGPTPEAINQVRIDPGSADAVIGCDVVVSSSPKASACYRRGTRVVLNLAEMPTGDVVRRRDADLAVPAREAAIAGAVGRGEPRRLRRQPRGGDAPRRQRLRQHDDARLRLAAGPRPGLLRRPRAGPSTSTASPASANHAAFACGRLMAAKPEAARRSLGPAPPPAESLDALIERRAAFLADYQDAAYAERYRARLAALRAALPAAHGRDPDRHRREVALQAHGLQGRVRGRPPARAARLRRKLAETFEGDFRVRYHLAPPFLPAGKDARGRPLKRSFGPWMTPLFRRLAGLRRLRGTWADPFGYTAERREERALIAWYEALLDRCAAAGGAGPWPEILAAPMDIRGYGPVKEAAIARVKAAVAALVN